MTPAARVQAAIVILDSVIEAARSNGPPAARIVQQWAKANRFAGSKDRRAIDELVFKAIRACGPVPDSGRAAMLRLVELDNTLSTLFDGSGYGPQPISESEQTAAGGVADAWLAEALAASEIDGPKALALLDRAPLDVRINTLKASNEALDLDQTPEVLGAPNALRFPTGTKINNWPAYRDGLIEIQDHGSQIACLAVDAKPGETVIDLCAGAGGKTLSLAAQMENQGALLASDVDRKRLAECMTRAGRAGAGMIETALLDPGKELERLGEWQGKADAVLVDAPCSGTGTLRRQPDARWRLWPESIERYSQTQDRLLELAAKLVKPGGRLVYVTCSLLDAEGADRIDQFLTNNTGWEADTLDLPLGRRRGKGMRLTPYHDGTDGFFIARTVSPC